MGAETGCGATTTVALLLMLLLLLFLLLSPIRPPVSVIVMEERVEEVRGELEDRSRNEATLSRLLRLRFCGPTPAPEDDDEDEVDNEGVVVLLMAVALLL